MKRIETAALLVRSVAYGEADVVATFFTESEGKVSAMVRSARRSRRRFAGALEPMHELAIALEDRGRDLARLTEARIARARSRLASDLDAMDAAGRALRWVRHVCPPRTPEPGAWAALRELLDALDEDADHARAPLARLAAFGLRLLTEVGYGLDLDRCVRCGRACPEGRAAFLDPGGGGLVCTACGGAGRTISGALRAAARAATAGEGAGGVAEHAAELVAIVEHAMAAHTGFEA